MSKPARSRSRAPLAASTEALPPDPVPVPETVPEADRLAYLPGKEAEKLPLPSCGDCRHWQGQGDGFGPCRRYPPAIPGPSLRVYGPVCLFPVVHASLLCGEHSPHAAAAASTLPSA